MKTNNAGTWESGPSHFRPANRREFLWAGLVGGLGLTLVTSFAWMPAPTAQPRRRSREPTDRERSCIEASLAAGKDPVQDLEDVFWGLLNSKEFIFNH